MNNFVTVLDNLKLQIRLDFVLKQDVKLILSLNTTITKSLELLNWVSAKKLLIRH